MNVWKLSFANLKQGAFPISFYSILDFGFSWRLAVQCLIRARVLFHFTSFHFFTSSLTFRSLAADGGNWTACTHPERLKKHMTRATLTLLLALT